MSTHETVEDREYKNEREVRAKWHKLSDELEDVASDISVGKYALKDQAEGQLRRAAELFEEHGGSPPPKLHTQIIGEIRAADENFERAERLERREKERRESAARVIHEPAPYGPDNPGNSWFLDVLVTRDKELRDVIARRTSCDMSSKAVQRRLVHHAGDVKTALRQRTPYGRDIEDQIRESCRWEPGPHGEALGQLEDEHRRDTWARVREKVESRAVGTDGGITAATAGEGGAFVSPAFLLKLFAVYRGKVRAFADQCNSEPLPDYGMKIYLPYFSGGTTVTEQTEGGSVAESSPSAALESGEVKSIAGRVVISEQLSERGFTGGYSFDKVLGEQLAQQLHERIDVYTLGVALTNGKAVTGAATFAIEKYYEDLAKGREEITGTAGTVLRPTHLFTTSNFYSYVTRQVDSTTKRPVVVPTFAPGCPLSKGADGDPLPQWSRFTGTIMPGGVLWFTDDNIPVVGTSTETQIIVSAPEESITLMETPPLLQVYPQTLAGTLEVEVILKSYACAITRHASGTAAIAGAGYTTSLV